MLTRTTERIRVELLLTGFRRRSNSGRDHDSSTLCENTDSLWRRAGLEHSDKVRIQIRWCLLFGGLILASLFAPLWIILFCGFGILLCEFILIHRKVFTRVQEFERDFPAMLLSLASAVRTGFDPLSALSRVKESLPQNSLVRKELEKLIENVSKGDTEREALAKFADSISHPDIPLFRTAFILSRERGSSLSPCLQRLTKVTRARQSFRRKVRAAIAMQRLSSIGIIVCAVIISSFQMLGNSSGLKEAWGHPIGFWMILVGGLLLCIGFMWMLLLGRQKV